MSAAPESLDDILRDNERTIAASAGAGEALWIFLDDCPDDRKPLGLGWIRVTTAWEAIGLIEAAQNSEMGRIGTAGLDLDHDLCFSGEDVVGTHMPSGYTVIKHLESRLAGDDLDLWPTDYLCIHAATATGRDNMTRGMEAHAARLGFERDRAEAYPTWRRGRRRDGPQPLGAGDQAAD